MAALEKSCGRPPAPPAAWTHQIHTAGRVSSSTTMVMLFVMLFVLFVPLFVLFVLSRLVVISHCM